LPGFPPNPPSLRLGVPLYVVPGLQFPCHYACTKIVGRPIMLSSLSFQKVDPHVFFPPQRTAVFSLFNGSPTEGGPPPFQLLTPTAAELPTRRVSFLVPNAVRPEPLLQPRVWSGFYVFTPRTSFFGFAICGPLSVAVQRGGFPTRAPPPFLSQSLTSPFPRSHPNSTLLPQVCRPSPRSRRLCSCVRVLLQTLPTPPPSLTPGF